MTKKFLKWTCNNAKVLVNQQRIDLEKGKVYEFDAEVAEKLLKNKYFKEVKSSKPEKRRKPKKLKKKKKNSPLGNLEIQNLLGLNANAFLEKVAGLKRVDDVNALLHIEKAGQNRESFMSILQTKLEKIGGKR